MGDLGQEDGVDRTGIGCNLIKSDLALLYSNYTIILVTFCWLSWLLEFIIVNLNILDYILALWITFGRDKVLWSEFIDPS
jgi:hypothetical protein